MYYWRPDGVQGLNGRARCVGLERTTAAPSRGLCGPPTVGAKDSLIGLLERGTHRRQRISALSTAALVREGSLITSDRGRLRHSERVHPFCTMLTASETRSDTVRT